MKNLLLTSLLLFTLFGSLRAQNGAWSAGIEGGPGISLIYGSQTIYENARPSLAGVGGIFGEYGFARNFSARVALHYERVSTRIDNFSLLLPPAGKLQYNLDYLSLPVLVKWSFGNRLRFFVNAGPTISLLLQQKLWYLPDTGSRSLVANETSSYSMINLAATVGAGVLIPVTGKIGISVELRDNFGLLNIRSATSDLEKKSSYANAVVKGYTNSTLLLVGVVYRFTSDKGLPCTPNDPDFQYIRK